MGTGGTGFQRRLRIESTVRDWTGEYILGAGEDPLHESRDDLCGSDAISERLSSRTPERSTTVVLVNHADSPTHASRSPRSDMTINGAKGSRPLSSTVSNFGAPYSNSPWKLIFEKM